MEKIQINSIQTKNIETQNMILNIPFMLLPMRTILFGLIQVLFVILLGFNWKESIAWWPFYAIITNIILFFTLSILAKREGKTFLDIIHFREKEFKQDLKRVLWILPIGAGLGFVGMSVVSYLMYGNPTPPENMILPLPTWAGVIALIFFPISNALVEIPTYMGYCLPRLEMIWKSKVAALLFAAFFLAFQHFTLPILVDDVKYMIWHFICFIPLSLIVGIIYIKIRRLVPIIIVHWIMDIMVVLGVFMLSI